MKNILLILIFLSLPLRNSFSERVFYDYVNTNRIENYENIIYKQKYAETLEFIKKHEGFREKVYLDINGFATIGYGFLIKYIDKKYRYKITKKEADSILNSKMQKNIQIIKKYYPNLNKYQNLSIAHLIYCKGLGKVLYHLINQQIKSKKINKNTLIYFSEYEVKRTHYRKTREYEWKLWNFKI